MKLWTMQLAQWRMAEKLGVPMVNTTVKSGHKFLAPVWNMVLDHKEGLMSDEDYTVLYFTLMNESYKNNPEKWEWLLSLDEVAIACYCRHDNFCHRKLLIDIIKRHCEEHGIEFHYCGEIHKGMTHDSCKKESQAEQVSSGDEMSG